MYKTKAAKKKFYNGKPWLSVREKAKDRDNNECQWCKANDPLNVVPMEEVHHIKEIYDYPELALELSNLVCLCKKCHNKAHKRFAGAKKVKEFDDERW